MRPRKGTKTLVPMTVLVILIFIYKDETPEGDENQELTNLKTAEKIIYKDETPEGDENILSMVFFDSSIQYL